MGFALDIVKKVEVGSTSSCVASSLSVELEEFQRIVEQFKELARDGVIEIKDLHKESQSGKRLVDLVRFVRLR